MNRQEQPGLVLSTYLKRLKAQLPEVADLSAVRGFCIVSIFVNIEGVIEFLSFL